MELATQEPIDIFSTFSMQRKATRTNQRAHVTLITKLTHVPITPVTQASLQVQQANKQTQLNEQS